MNQPILSLHYGRIAVLGPSWIWVRRTLRIAVPVSTFPTTAQQRELNLLSNSMFVLWKSKRLTKSHKYKLYTGVLAAMLYACPTWRRSPDVLKAINGANATMISVISRKKSLLEA